MPVHDKIGHSEATITKQEGLSKILQQHLAVCKNILGKHKYYPQQYYYFDINAGCGFNDTEQCKGSPLIFLDATHDIELAYEVMLIEKDQDNACALRAALPDQDNITVFPSDNRDVLPQLIHNCLPRNGFGVIYHDPNGVPDFSLLTHIFNGNQKTRKLDVLIRLAGSSIKRTKHLNHKKLSDFLAAINKKFWIVKDLDGSDKWQWTFLLGLNWDGLRCWKSQGFHYINSAEGEDIFQRLNYNRQELQEIRQPELPYANYDEYLRHPTFRAIRSQAIAQANGVCQRCYKRPVTEVHHLKYPKWGTFDVPENLLPVCHQCHCELHDKEN